MNIDDMLYEEKTLEDRYNENENLCAILDERARMAKVNQLDYKVTEIFGMTMIPYIILLLIGIISSAQTLNVISMIWFTLGSAAISLPIGLITSALINKKYKTKKKFKEFSNAKKESEKIELQLLNELQLERIKNRNSVLEQTMEKLHTSKLNITCLSKYKGLDMSILPKDLEKVLEEKQSIKNELEQKYNELDLLSIKSFLLNNLGKYMLKGQSTMEILLNSFMYAIMPCMLLFMPVIMIAKQGMTIPTILGNIELGLLGISVTTSTIYNLNKNRVQKEFFDKVNNLLGDNKLIKKLDGLHEEIIEVNELLNQKKLEICKIELKKEECERSLQTLGDKEEIEKINESYMHTFSKEKEDNNESILEVESNILINRYFEKDEKQKVKTLKKY